MKKYFLRRHGYIAATIFVVASIFFNKVLPANNVPSKNCICSLMRSFSKNHIFYSYGCMAAYIVWYSRIAVATNIYQ